MAKMTLDQKIEYYEEQLAKLRAEKAALAIRDNIQQGDEVVFTFGRGETKKELNGTVLGVKDDTNGRWVAVASGEGFDMQTFKVRTADIVSNPAADERNKADASANTEETPAEAPKAAPKKSAAKDPLEAE